jgi:hypothetical protein
MNEQRAFTVVVTGCSNCPNYSDEFGTCKLDCINKGIAGYRGDYNLIKANEVSITTTCPMWNEAKHIGELK